MVCIPVQVFLVDDMGWLHIWTWVSERLVFCDRILQQGSDPLFGIGCNTVCPHTDLQVL